MKRIIIIDESMFYLKGHVNRQTTRYWSQENPYWTAEVNCQDEDRVMVLGGIWGDMVLGPYFFEGNVDGLSF